MDQLAAVYDFIDTSSERFVEELREFIRYPSQAGHLDEVRSCASYLVGLARRSSWGAELVHVDDLGPFVLATRPAPPGGQTVLLYSHYDVVSAEPVEEWTYPPFGATLVDGRIFGRGTADSKANALALIKGVEALERGMGELPCGVKLILDGEEERGSSNLPLLMETHREQLAADAVVSFDGAIDASGVPKIGLGTSGMLYVELEVRGARKELHSAGARLFVNPAWRLIWALASIKGVDERITIDGFYDDVAPPSSEDRQMMARMRWNDRLQLEEAGLESFLTGVRGLDAVQRLLFQPGLAICGISSGFVGDGMKSVIPNKAQAKLEFRIVPNQTPERTLAMLRDHLDRQGFEDVVVRTLATVETAKTGPDAGIVRATVDAARDLYGEPMLKPTEEYAGRQGAWLGRLLNVPGVQTGVGSPASRGHSTDEYVTVEHFIKGVKFAATILARYACL